MSLRPCFIINEIDYIQYIKCDGIEWECNDLDSEESGRTLDGLMHRSKVTEKRKITVNLIPVITEVFSEISQALNEEFVDIKILDPKLGAQTVFTFYGSSIKAATMFFDGNDCKWTGGQFNLIER